MEGRRRGPVAPAHGTEGQHANRPTIDISLHPARGLPGVTVCFVGSPFPFFSSLIRADLAQGVYAVGTVRVAMFCVGLPPLNRTPHHVQHTPCQDVKERNGPRPPQPRGWDGLATNLLLLSSFRGELLDISAFRLLFRGVRLPANESPGSGSVRQAVGILTPHASPLTPPASGIPFDWASMDRRPPA